MIGKRSLLVAFLLAISSSVSAGDRPSITKPTFLNPPPERLSKTERSRASIYRQSLQSEVQRLERESLRNNGAARARNRDGSKPNRAHSRAVKLQSTRQELNRINRVVRGRPALRSPVGSLNASGRAPLRR